MLSSQQLDRFALKAWMLNGKNDNCDDLERAKRMIIPAMEASCTEKQKTYIVHYFVDEMTTTEIARIYGISKSSVSRGIHSGLKNLYRCMRFSVVSFVDVPLYEKRLRRKKVHHD